MRILITGSRDWVDSERLHTVLFNEVSKGLATEEPVTVVHGDASRGADRLTRDWLQTRTFIGVTEESHPANWKRWGQGAGTKRNSDMVALGADLVLAFWNGESSGTHDCINKAIEAGLRTNVYFGEPSRQAGTVHEFNVRPR